MKSHEGEYPNQSEGGMGKSLPRSEPELEEFLSEPPSAVLKTLRDLDSDLVILGVGGKMGPTLARMAVRALEQAGSRWNVYGVSRFGTPGLRDRLESWGVHTVAADLFEHRSAAVLPDSRNVIYMIGQKFGTSGDAPLTWAANTYVPSVAAGRYAGARIVVFSTGNVYPLTPIGGGGSVEGDPLEPVGEYADSCLGRERLFEFFSQRQGIRCSTMRLNYAVELRYGVLVDIARRVFSGMPVDVSTGMVNVIWQGDANACALRLLSHCSIPPFVLNVTGPEMVSVRRAAERFGQLFGLPVTLAGVERDTALLSNASLSHRMFGYPRVSVDQIIEWTAEWVSRDLPVWEKPTHYDVRNGRF